MKLLTRHVGVSVLAATCFVLLVLVGIDVISAIIDQADNLRGDYDFSESLIYVLLSVPSRIEEYIPFAALVGALIGLGTLANQSELIVMRASGVATGRIIWMVMQPALLLMLLGLVISEFVAPPAEQLAGTRRALAQNDAQAFSAKSGLWNREENEFMHFNVVQSLGVVHGVTLLRFNDKHQLQSSVFAETARYVDDKWLLENGVQTILQERAISRSDFATLQWQTTLSPSLLSLVVLEPDDLSVSGLWSYANHLQEQGQSAADYLLAFWSKLLQPLGTASLVLIAISFVFGPLREVTMGYRVFIGVLVGIVFRTSQDMLGPSSVVFGFQPMYAILMPILVCAAIGLILLRRTG